MSQQLLALGVIGVRLYDCVLTASAQYPEELADAIVDEINNCLAQASLNEKAVLFHISCDIHEALSKRFDRIDGLARRKAVLDLLGVLICRARSIARLHGH